MVTSFAGHAFVIEMNAGAGVTSAPAGGDIAFVVATRFERQCVERGLNASVASGGPAGSAVCISCGIGCSIEGALQALDRFRCVISTGFAAGLHDNTKAGTLLLPERIHGENGNACAVSREWHTRIRSALAGVSFARDKPISTEPIVHADKILAMPDEKHALSHGGTFVGADMESALIAAACHAHEVPFLALRVVLDPVNATVPGSIVATAANGAEPKASTLIRELMRRPGDLRHGFAFARYIINAQRTLTNTITRVANALAGRTRA